MIVTAFFTKEIKRLIFAGIFLCTLSIAHASVSDEPWLLKEEFLSPNSTHFDCHGSSLVETEKGNLCAVWKGGPGEGKSNIDIKENVGIWSSVFDGSNWSEPVEIVTAEHSVCWNPVLCKYPSGELTLFYRIGPDPRRTVSFIKRSDDGGLTWSKEEILPAGIVGPTKNKPIVTANGTLICPSSVTVGEPEDPFKATACWIEISEDKGVHWKKVGPLELPNRKFGVVEPALFFDSKGNLRMFCRDRANKIGEKGCIWEAISHDSGLHWSEFKQTNFPNPDSGFDIVDLGEGKIFLFYNHSHINRFPLNFAISLDGGDHWSQPFVLDKGEFPAAILTTDGLIHVTYATTSLESEQQRIKHVVINPKQVFEGKE